jgi:hypothetical protein
MRAVQIADDAEVFVRLGGIDAAVGMLRSRRGTEFDPTMVDLVARHADDVLGDLEQDAWDETMRASDGAEHSLDDSELTRCYCVRRLRGPEVGVVDGSLARRPGGGGGARCSSPAEERILVEQAALVHDTALGVSTGIWDKAGPWSGPSVSGCASIRT